MGLDLAYCRNVTFKLKHYRAVCWLDDAGEEVDFDAYALRLHAGQAAAE